MEIDYSNKRYQLIFAGILLLLIVSVFIAFASGINGNIFFFNKDTLEQKGVSYHMKKNNQIDLLTDPSDIYMECDNVQIDQYTHESFTVEPGYVELIDDNLEGPLPICLTPEWAEGKYLLYEVKGGYDLTGGMLTVSQYGDIVKNPCTGQWVGWSLDWTYLGWDCESDECCVELWNVTFDTSCDNSVCLDSTSDPDGQQHPEKEVDFEIKTTWQGCEFDHILAHERHVPEIPNSRIN